MIREPIRISIITISFNSERTIERTIKSVIDQDYCNIEYIIIDGNSTDNTLSIINTFDSNSFLLKSENDKGISDAFNKGIDLCTGDLIAFLNADDWYVNKNIISLIVQNYVDQNTIICGSIRLMSEIQSELKILHSIPSKLNKGMYVLHPTCFVPIELIRKVGYFNKNFKIAMDFDLFVRMKLVNANFRVLPILITNMQAGGISYNYKQMAKEELIVKNTYFGKRLTHYFYFYFTISLYKLRTLFKN